MHVLYSMHASHDELVAFVGLLEPGQVLPLNPGIDPDAINRMFCGEGRRRRRRRGLMVRATSSLSAVTPGNLQVSCWASRLGKIDALALTTSFLFSLGVCRRIWPRAGA